MFVLRVCVFYVPVVKMFAIALDRAVLHLPWIALLLFFLLIDANGSPTLTRTLGNALETNQTSYGPRNNKKSESN